MTPPFCNPVPILHALIPLREMRQLPVLRIAVLGVFKRSLVCCLNKPCLERKEALFAVQTRLLLKRREPCCYKHFNVSLESVGTQSEIIVLQSTSLLLSF